MIEDRETAERLAVHLEPWGEGNLPLLERRNTAEMTRFVGGPEAPEQLADRQVRYETPDSLEPLHGAGNGERRRRPAHRATYRITR